MKQYTYMMLKPDTFQNHQEQAVLSQLQSYHLMIEKASIVKVDMDVMKILLEHYHRAIDERGKVFHFPARLFNTFYFDGVHYIMPLKVSYDGRQDIIAYSRKIVGKTNPIEADKQSIRGQFSQDSYTLADQEYRLVHNIIHAASSHEDAQKELKIWAQFLE